MPVSSQCVGSEGVTPSVCPLAWALSPARDMSRSWLSVARIRVICPAARWGVIEPVLTTWRAERRRHAWNVDRPPEHGLREIMNTILYVDRTGAQGRYLPHNFPRWNTVYGYFAEWADEGVFVQLNGFLRHRASRHPPASPPSARASTPGRKVVGRKRNIVTETLGLLLAVLVTAASAQDSAAPHQREHHLLAHSEPAD
ncbi:hypothetical protein GCM10022227_33790 [Streptomyces sedi]